MFDVACEKVPTLCHRLLRASAGTGKTYQLVEAYTQLVETQGINPQHILVITFTRKAAAELRQRIAIRLQQTVALACAPIGNFHGLALQLLDMLGCPVPWLILADGAKARRLFFDACYVAWFAKHVSLNIQQAVQHVAAHMDIEHGLPQALWDVCSRAREDGPLDIARLFGCYDVAGRQVDVQQKLLQLRHGILTAASNITPLTSLSAEKLQRFANMPIPSVILPAADFVAAWQAVFACLDRRGALRDIFCEAAKDMLQDDLESVVAEDICASLQPSLVLLMQRAWDVFVEMKQHLGAVDFGDMIANVVHLLENDASLHARICGHFRAVFVDEAQDTNLLQRRFVALLAGIEGPAAEASSAGQLFVVGDWKQSIYTFRGANPQSFELFAQMIHDLGGREDYLSISRRSCAALIAGINHLGVALFGSAYEALQPLNADDHTPHGMFWCAYNDTQTTEAMAVVQAVQQQLDAGFKPGDCALLLATMTDSPVFLEALTKHGIATKVIGGGGFYQQFEVQDIFALLTWLCDANAKLAAAIALRSPIFGLSDASLSYLFAPLDLSFDPLMSLREGDVQIDHHFLTEHDAMLLKHAARVLPQLIAQVHHISASSMLQMIYHKLELFDVYAHHNLHRLYDLALQFDTEDVPSVYAFVHENHIRMQHGHDEPLAKPQEDDTLRDYLTISTVHQSKGLQYPVVLLASLDKRSRQDTASMRYSKQHGIVFKARVSNGRTPRTVRFQQSEQEAATNKAAELRRLLYVAITRAEKNVIFVAPKDDNLGRDGFAEILSPWHVTAAQACVLRYVHEAGA